MAAANENGNYYFWCFCCCYIVVETNKFSGHGLTFRAIFSNQFQMFALLGIYQIHFCNRKGADYAIAFPILIDLFIWQLNKNRKHLTECVKSTKNESAAQRERNSIVNKHLLERLEFQLLSKLKQIFLLFIHRDLNTKFTFFKDGIRWIGWTRYTCLLGKLWWARCWVCDISK